MKKKWLFLMMAALSLTACHRSSRDAWEDTKTCGRYVNRGMRSLFGKHVDENEPYLCWDDKSNVDAEFITMNGEFSYLTSDERGGIPQPKESPGDPGSAIPGIEKFVTPTGELAKLFSAIHFETDSYSIKGEETFHTLQEIAHFLVKHPHTYIFVEGHADERGAAAYNLALGAKRANAVRNCLIQNGVNPDQLFTISYGKEKPLVMGHDAGTWQKNRRSQFKLYDR